MSPSHSEPAVCESSATVDKISRVCTVDDYGRLTVEVNMTGVSAPADQHGKLPPIILATIAPPYGRVIRARNVKVGTSIDAEQVKEAWIGRATKPLRAFWFEPRTALQSTSIQWRFRVSAAFPFQLADLLYPSTDYWQRAAGSSGRVARDRTKSANKLKRLARGHVLGLEPKRFELIYDLPNCELFRFHARVEERRRTYFDMSHTWVAKDVTECGASVVYENTNRIRLTVERPKKDWRYAIELEPKEPHDDNSKWAIKVASAILDNTRGHKYGQHGLIDELNAAVEEQLRNFANEVLGPSEAIHALMPTRDSEGVSEKSKVAGGQGIHQTISLRGFLWHDGKTGLGEPSLLGCFGNSRLHLWGTSFEYGCGLAGHVFRLNRAIIYGNPAESSPEVSVGGDEEDINSKEMDDVLLLDSREQRRPWMIGVPLRIAPDSAAIGVVRLAGRTTESGDCRTAQALRTIVENGAEANKLIETLMFRLNLAFWEKIRDSKLTQGVIGEHVNRVATAACGSYLQKVVTDRPPPGEKRSDNLDRRQIPWQHVAAIITAVAALLGGIGAIISSCPGGKKGEEAKEGRNSVSISINNTAEQQKHVSETKESAATDPAKAGSGGSAGSKSAGTAGSELR